MGFVKLNRIKAVLAETDKPGKWLAQQLGKGPITVPKWCANTIRPDLKTHAEIAEILNVNIRNCSLIPNNAMTSQSDGRPPTISVRKRDSNININF